MVVAVLADLMAEVVAVHTAEAHRMVIVIAVVIVIAGRHQVTQAEETIRAREVQDHQVVLVVQIVVATDQEDSESNQSYLT